MAQSILAGFAALSLIGVAPFAHAQEAQTSTADATSADGTKLETVTVTARKRSEQQLDVPVSVQAFGEKEIRESQIFDLYDLKSRAGFNFTSYSAGAAGRSNGVIVFRGLQGNTGLVNENSGSVFIDGIYISSGQASINTLDTARVEVLKGPQNAYFGRSTFGGAINFITKTPAQDRLHAEVNSTFTDRGSSDVDISVEGPIVQNLVSARLTAYNHDKVAPYKSTDGGDLGGEKSRGITGTLYVTPSENLWLRGRVNFQKDDDGTAAYGFIPAAGNTSCNGVLHSASDINGNPIQYTTGVPYFCGSIPTHGQTGDSVVDSNTSLPLKVYNQLSQNYLNDQFLSKGPKLDHMGLRRDIVHTSAQGGLNLPYDMQLVFNAGYNQSNQVSAYDALDASAQVQNFYNIQTIVTHDTTVDARLETSRNQPIRGSIGASYFEQVYQLSQDDYNLAFGATALALNTGNFANNKSKVPAAYGAVEWDILPNLTLAGEARYQQDKITSLAYDASARYDNKKENWLPRASLRFKPIDDLMIYASAAKGVQPLVLNTGYISANAASQAYLQSVVPGTSQFTPQPKVNTYEVGVKQRLLDGRVQYSATAYTSQWENRLTFSNVFNNTLICPASVTGTAACPLPVSGVGVYYSNNARIKGVEFSADALIMKGWTVGVDAAYTNARWTNFYLSSLSSTVPGAAVLNGNAFNFNGNELGKQPKWTASYNSTYRMPGVYQDFGGYVRGDVLFTGKSWESDYNYARVDSFYRVNLRGGVENKAMTVELFVKNLFNNKDWLFAYRGTNFQLSPLTSFSQQGVYVVPGDPREFGVRLAYRF